MDTRNGSEERKSPQKLLDYVDIITLKKLLDAFTTTTGLMANMVDIHGRSIFSPRDVKRCCKFCKIIFRQEHGRERCQQAYERAGKQAAIFKEPYIFRCPSGLMEFAAPIIVDKEHIGTIICGQVLMWEPEDFFWIELREMNKDLNVDYKELFQSVEELPVLSGPQVQAAAYLLYVVANYIMNAGWKNYQQAREVEMSQSLLHEEIKSRKTLEKQLNFKDKENSPIKENEITAAFLGNANDGADFFQKLIAMLRYESNNDIRSFRLRSAELIAMTTRAAEKMGIAQQNYTEVTDAAMHRLYEAVEEKEIILALNYIIDFYFKSINKETDLSSNMNVRTMISYMNDKYPQQLSLEDIALSAELSPSYASRLFKKSTGMSVTDYLVQIRMENAKKFLLNPHYQIEEISSNVGYNDSSYFTKAFRKYEGTTPTDYRKRKK